MPRKITQPWTGCLSHKFFMVIASLISFFCGYGPEMTQTTKQSHSVLALIWLKTYQDRMKQNRELHEYVMSFMYTCNLVYLCLSDKRCSGVVKD